MESVSRSVIPQMLSVCLTLTRCIWLLSVVTKNRLCYFRKKAVFVCLIFVLAYECVCVCVYTVCVCVCVYVCVCICVFVVFVTVFINSAHVYSLLLCVCDGRRHFVMTSFVDGHSVVQHRVII